MTYGTTDEIYEVENVFGHIDNRWFLVTATRGNESTSCIHVCKAAGTVTGWGAT